MSVKSPKKSEIYWRQKTKQYKKMSVSKELAFQISWQTNIDQIDLSSLVDMMYNPLIETIKKDFQILELNLNEVIKLCHNCQIKKFKGDNLWSRVFANRRIVKLIDFIQNQNKIFPPVLIPIENKIYVVDGNHRMAICKFLKIQKIPFIVEINAPFLAKMRNKTSY